MSYTEYFDLFNKAQKKECPYRAFTFDIKNSKTNGYDVFKFHNLISLLYKKLENYENQTNKKVVLNNKFNNLNIYRKDSNNLLNNPMILGDMFTVFVHNGSISESKMIELFVMCLNELNIDYKFHFMTGKYETDHYELGNKKLYKGYVPAILEHFSKSNEIIIDKNYNLGIER